MYIHIKRSSMRENIMRKESRSRNGVELSFTALPHNVEDTLLIRAKVLFEMRSILVSHKVLCLSQIFRNTRIGFIRWTSSSVYLIMYVLNIKSHILDQLLEIVGCKNSRQIPSSAPFYSFERINCEFRHAGEREITLIHFGPCGVNQSETNLGREAFCSLRKNSSFIPTAIFVSSETFNWTRGSLRF